MDLEKNNINQEPLNIQSKKINGYDLTLNNTNIVKANDSIDIRLNLQKISNVDYAYNSFCTVVFYRGKFDKKYYDILQININEGAGVTDIAYYQHKSNGYFNFLNNNQILNNAMSNLVEKNKYNK